MARAAALRDRPLAVGERLSSAPAAVGMALIFAAAVLICAVTLLKGLNLNDEGLMLQAAARIADGEVPYSDFWWFYPPGQPYLLALLWEIFGPSLLAWRIVRLLVNGIAAVLVYRLARRHASVPLSLLGSLAAVLAMVSPSGPHPYPVAVVLALGALLTWERSPVAAGVLTGVCAAWRIEFAAYLGLGVLLACLLGTESARGRRAGVFTLSSLLAAAALYLPVVAQSGIGPSWELLIRYPLLDFSDYQTLPLPLVYEGSFGAGSLKELRESIAGAMHLYLPLMLLVGLSASLLALALSLGRRGGWIAAGVFSIGMAHYLITRPDAFHTAPLAVMLGVLGPWAVAGVRARVGVRAGPRVLRLVAPGAAAVAALVLVYTVVDGIERREREISAPTVTVDVPGGDGVQELAAFRCTLLGAPVTETCFTRSLEQTVAFVRSRVPPGDPIYVGTLRADLVTSGAPMVYVLADRPNATRYDIAAPGVVTSAPVQREITRDLTEAGLPLVVRYVADITAAPEPNRAGRSTGVRILDEFYARNYRTVRRFGAYLVLERRGAPGTTAAQAQRPSS